MSSKNRARAGAKGGAKTSAQHPYARAQKRSAGARSEKVLDDVTTPSTISTKAAPVGDSGALGSRPTDRPGDTTGDAAGLGDDGPTHAGSGGPYRITRAALVLIALALGLGLLVGRVSVKSDDAAPATTTVTPTATSVAVPISSKSLPDTGSLCAVQSGSRLQLGVEVRNVSTEVIYLQQLRVQFPKGGLRLVGTSAGACGELSVPRLAGFGLPPQGTVWLTADAAVTVRCPSSSSVAMTVDALDPTGKVLHFPVSSFSSLGSVDYSGCTAGTGRTTSTTPAAASQSTAKPARSTAKSTTKRTARSTAKSTGKTRARGASAASTASKSASR